MSASLKEPLNVLAIMPHPDDFEFNAGGTFALLRARYGDAVRLKVITTSTGASGHHLMSPEETFARRQAEARASATLIGADYECLTQLDGSHVEGQVIVNRNLLGGIWNAIRAFKADLLFSPPPATDPLAGIHIDHEQTAQAVRMVAYQLGVPRAYPTVGASIDAEYRPPVILLTDDTYSAERQFDFAPEISEVYTTKLAMAECHASQVFEWLPFQSGRPPTTREEYAHQFQERHRAVNRRFGLAPEVPREFFRLSRWGRAPRPGELEALFSSGAAKAEGQGRASGN